MSGYLERIQRNARDHIEYTKWHERYCQNQRLGIWDGEWCEFPSPVHVEPPQGFQREVCTTCGRPLNANDTLPGEGICLHAWRNEPHTTRTETFKGRHPC